MTGTKHRFVCHGLVAVCCVCKRVRDGLGVWHRLDPGERERLGGLVTHGICQACAVRLYPGFLDEAGDPLNQASGGEVVDGE